MSFDQHKNFSYSTVAVAPNPQVNGTSLTVSVGDGGLFAHFPFNAVLFPPNVQPTVLNAELVRVTNRVGDVLTITRGQESSTAQPITAGYIIAAGITAKTISDIEDEISAIWDKNAIYDSQITDIYATLETKIGTDAVIKSYIGNLMMPVGFVYTSIISTNPATVFGFGTWEAIAVGEALVGYKSGDTPFGTIGSIGAAGEKVHTLTAGELASHNHTQNAHNHTQDAHSHLIYSPTNNMGAAGGDIGTEFVKSESNKSNTTRTTTATNNSNTATNNATAAGTSHNNIQPSYVVYIFKRTA